MAMRELAAMLAVGSPLRSGERDRVRSAERAAASRLAARDWSAAGTVRKPRGFTPHPALRATFSPEERREEEEALYGNA
jgi:hypothetical protein